MPAITYTRQAAARIAYYGALKMPAQGYTMNRTGQSGNMFHVTKPATETEAAKVYTVIISGQGTGDLHICNCPFSGEGFENHTCKHARFVQNLVLAEINADNGRADNYAEEAAAKVGAGYHDRTMFPYEPMSGDPALCKEYAY